MFISNDKKASEKKPFYVRNQDGIFRNNNKVG